VRRIAALTIGAACLIGSLSAAVAAPLGYTQPKYLERANAPIPEWAKAHPRLTTEQTPGVSHSCTKDLHTQHCVKRCIKRSQKVQRMRSVQATILNSKSTSH
jgi:hypothetical protein